MLLRRLYSASDDDSECEQNEGCRQQTCRQRMSRRGGLASGRVGRRTSPTKYRSFEDRRSVRWSCRLSASEDSPVEPFPDRVTEYQSGSPKEDAHHPEDDLRVLGGAIREMFGRQRRSKARSATQPPRTGLAAPRVDPARETGPQSLTLGPVGRPPRLLRQPSSIQQSQG